MGTRAGLLSISFLVLVTGAVTSAQRPAPPPLVLRLEADRVQAVTGEPIEFRVSTGDGRALPPYLFDFGDGSEPRLMDGERVVASYAQSGHYRPSVRVPESADTPAFLPITVQDPPPAPPGPDRAAQREPVTQPEPPTQTDSAQPVWPYLVAGVAALAVVVGALWRPSPPVTPQAAALPMTLHARLEGPWRFVPPSTSRIALEVRYAANLSSLRFTRPPRPDGAPR